MCASDGSAGPRQQPRVPDSNPETVARIRAGLQRAAFTVDGCLDALGATAYAALSRSESVPGLRATATSTAPLDGLIRLFLLQAAVPAAHLASVLPVEECLAAGWLEPAAAGTDAAGTAAAGTVRATVDIRPYGEADTDWWIVSDLGRATGGPGTTGAADLVLGVGGASTTLAGLTVRTPVRSALDLGTGSGVQALHASRHSETVTATDLNPRALRFAALTLALSGVPAERVELRQGSLFEPVAERRFDLIISNPPFVISPAKRLIYRDGGLSGDELCRTVVTRGPEHLTEGGHLQLLANWQHMKGEDWRERLASWIAPTGCDAWVVQRDVQDPARYAELWLRDAGDHRTDPATYAARYDAWLEGFEREGVEGIGFGWITLRAAGHRDPAVHIEEWPHPVEQQLGPEISRWFAAQDHLRSHDDAALLAGRLRLAENVLQEQIGRPGAEDPEHVVLRQGRGMMRATQVDSVGAGFAGACDGTLPAGAILDAIAQIIDEDPVVLRDRTPENIRLLVEQGFLGPADGPAH